MTFIATVLALIMTFLSVSITLLALCWIAKAIVLYMVCKKFKMPKPWLVFIPICTEPYMGFMVNKLVMYLHIGLFVLLIIAGGLPYISLFATIAVLYVLVWNYTCYQIYQRNKLYTIVTAILPVLFPLFLYKTYITKDNK